jgi:chromosomal replication initiation ATPase DnaA
VPDKSSDNPLWETILERLPDTVSSAQKARWLAPLRIKKTSETLEVEVGSAFRAEYVSRTFGDQLQSAARSLGIKRVALVGAPLDTHGTSSAEAAG